MGKAIGWIVSYFGEKLVRRALLMVFVSGLLIVVITFFKILVKALFELYNQILYLIDLITQSSDGLEIFYGLLSCIGFVDAVNYVMPLFLGAVIFNLSVISYGLLISLYKFATDGIDKITR